MATARILTWDPDSAGRVQQHLIAFGFEVEIARPDEPRHSPADLEINLEECEVQEALRRAALAPPGTEVIIAASVFQRAHTPPSLSAAPSVAPEIALIINPEQSSSAAQSRASGAFHVAAREAGINIPDYFRQTGARLHAHATKLRRETLAASVALLATASARLRVLGSRSEGARPGRGEDSPFGPGWLRSTLTGALVIVAVVAIVVALQRHRPAQPRMEVGTPALLSSAPAVAPTPAPHLRPAARKANSAGDHSSRLTPAKPKASRLAKGGRRRVRDARHVVAADDVVVRHFPSKRTTMQAKSGEVKRYSDWDDR